MSILKRLNVPVFKAGGFPDINKDNYKLHVRGLAEKPLVYSLRNIKEMPFSSVSSRLLSVSGWSVRAVWEGVLWRDFIRLVNLLPQANHATFISVDGGYDTTISLDDLDHPRVMLVYRVEGEPLEPEYGGPLRMVVPNLYGYKSAKWLGTIEFCDSMRGGFWEDRGYTRSGIIEKGYTMDINTAKRVQIKGGEVIDF